MAKLFFGRDKKAAYFNMGVMFPFSILMAVICALLRSLSYLFFFDTDPGYFAESFLPQTAGSMLVVVTVFLLCGFFFIAKDAELCRSLDTADNTVFFTSVFAGFILLADFAFKVYTIIGDDKISYYKFIFDKAYKADDAYTSRAVAIIQLVGVIASVAAACCFFVRSSKKVNRRLSAILGFFPVVRALVGIAQIYFEMKIQMNHPSKLMLQFALIAIMLFFLAEERYFISESHIRPRSYFVFGCIALYLGFVGGVSEMVGFFSGKLTRGDFCVEAFLCLVMSIYAFARMKAFAYYVPHPDAGPEKTELDPVEAESVESFVEETPSADVEE